MSDPAITPATALGGAGLDGPVRVTEEPPRGMIALKGDLASEALRTAVTGLTGTGFPEPLRACLAGDRGILWMAPDELLILCPHADIAGHLGAIAGALAGTHHLCTDVSDARSLFLVEGGSAREVLAKLTPADLAPDAFLPGSFRRTRLAQVPAGLWMRDDGAIGVMAFRSVAQYVFDLLTTAADADASVGYF